MSNKLEKNIQNTPLVSFLERISISFSMAEMGANSTVLETYFVIDKQLSLAINKDKNKFRKGSGWLMTHVIHRMHANIVYKMYCTAVPCNANLSRNITAKELISLARAYELQHGNEYIDINRIFYIFGYMQDATFQRKTCSCCGIDYIFHSDRNYVKCPWCERRSLLFKKNDDRCNRKR